jgi:hypothetical protein
MQAVVGRHRCLVDRQCEGNDSGQVAGGRGEGMGVARPFGHARMDRRQKAQSQKQGDDGQQPLRA